MESWPKTWRLRIVRVNMFVTASIRQQPCRTKLNSACKCQSRPKHREQYNTSFRSLSQGTIPHIERYRNLNQFFMQDVSSGGSLS